MLRIRLNQIIMFGAITKLLILTNRVWIIFCCIIKMHLKFYSSFRSRPTTDKELYKSAIKQEISHNL